MTFLNILPAHQGGPFTRLGGPTLSHPLLAPNNGYVPTNNGLPISFPPTYAPNNGGAFPNNHPPVPIVAPPGPPNNGGYVPPNNGYTPPNNGSAHPDQNVAQILTQHLHNAIALARDPELHVALSQALNALHKHIATVEKEHQMALQGKLSPRLMQNARPIVSPQ